MCGAPIEALTVVAAQDWAFAAFADGQVDGARCTRHQRYGRGLVGFAHNPQRAMPALEAQVFDIGGARFANSQSVKAEQDRQRGMRVAVMLGGEEENAEFGAVQATRLRGMQLRSA